jgi:hypothetical protein
MRFEENFNLDIRNIFFLVVFSAKLAVAADTAPAI